jgi:hypothetical protein
MIGDLELRQDVLDELEFEPSVNAAHIGVTANKVTLTGTTLASELCDLPVREMASANLQKKMKCHLSVICCPQTQN